MDSTSRKPYPALSATGARGAEFSDSLRQRILRNIEIDSNGCWIWQLAKDRDGYGKMRVQNKDTTAHRVSYVVHVGPIPTHLCIDHLCRNRGCCNPDHLECVTERENILRGVSPSAKCAKVTHCPKGHPYDAINTYIQPRTGKRNCKACRRKTRG